MRAKIFPLFLLLLLPNVVAAQTAMPVILSLQERAALRDQWLALRLQKIVPELLRREGIDMWLIIAREDNEDPVITTMLPATWLAARRRTILVFFDPGPDKEVERLAVTRYDIGSFFKKAWEPEKQPDQWQRLVEIIRERNPHKIAIDYSSAFALADGLSKSELDAFKAVLSAAFQSRLVSGERLAIGWLERRLPEEMVVYPRLCRIAHCIIAEGFSSAVIQPGFTTTEQLEWWYRERISALHLDTWFHPSVTAQRADADQPGQSTSFAAKPDAKIIIPGDLLHIDFGISYLGLHTDTQEHAYVLEPGETAAPAGLQAALAVGNRLQDILMANFKVGATGNQILAQSLAQAKAEGIKPCIYTHPIGFHGHGAGPTIGLWDQQDGVPGSGDYPVFANTAYSIELNVTVAIPEWQNKAIRIMLEEDAYFSGDDIRFLDGRQTELILIR